MYLRFLSKVLISFLMISSLLIRISSAQNNDSDEIIDYVEPHPFMAGRSFFSAGGGGGADFIDLQGTFSYFIIDGLTIDLTLSGRIPFDDGIEEIFSITPGLTYYLYPTRPFVPYGGFLYQHQVMGFTPHSPSAWGARAGLMLLLGSSQFGFGARYLKPFRCGAGEEDCGVTLPEFFLSVSF